MWVTQNSEGLAGHGGAKALLARAYSSYPCANMLRSRFLSWFLEAHSSPAGPVCARDSQKENL